MRVLMVCPELPTGDCPGSMAPAARQFESLRRLGVQVDVIDLVGLPVLKYLTALPRVRKAARDVKVVHAHFGYCGWLACIATLFMRNRPAVVMSFMGDDLLGTPYNAQGDLEWFSKIMVRANKWLANKFAAVIVKSQEMANVIAPVACDVVPNGVNVETFQPVERTQARRMLGLDTEGYYSLFPGDPSNPRKGIDLAEPARQHAEAVLGKPFRQLTLWDIEPDEVPLYMSACDVMTMTSQIEGSPNVVKEALACNTRVVGVDVGDVPQMLAGISGCELCDRDPIQIGDAMARLATSPEGQGRTAVLERGLDLESVGGRVLRIYRTALGQEEADPSKKVQLERPTQSSEACGSTQPKRQSVEVGG